MNDKNLPGQFGRRAFLEKGALVLTTASLCPATLVADDNGAKARDTKLRIGLVTDLHYADKKPAGTRHYRETLGKLEEAAEKFRKIRPHFIVELGDFIDAAASVDIERRYLKTVNDAFSKICKERHYVLGNHCVDTLTKDEFLGVSGNKSRTTLSIGAGSTLSCWTHVFAPTENPTSVEISNGRTPTFPLRNSIGSRRT